jgi:hypothetical protein
MNKLLRLFAVAVIVAALGMAVYPTAEDASGSAACSTSGSVSAALQVGGPFDGWWKYTITGSWDTGGEALSHISFLISYACDCCDISGLIGFDTPAGTSTGEDGLGNACTAEYVGTGDMCSDDPTIPSTDPALKFEPVEGDCEAQSTGNGTWCFYSLLPPLPAANYPGAVVVKYGNNLCSGDLVGEMPDCTDCLTVPTRLTTWGKLKGDYKD